MSYNDRNTGINTGISTAGDKIAISAKELGKFYKIYSKPHHRLQEAFPFQGSLGKEFWAVRGISFDLLKGETLGIVGRNGSGKSTLLQILSGIISPSEGSYDCQGRIGALLELGSGFNPEFTGIENVFLNGSLLGIDQDEIKERLDAILDFAGIGDFAHQATKTYSSGMTIRLAFAVQALLRPDILIVDEALAVGDEMFQKKCYNHIRHLKESGTSILLVTHNCHQVIEHCDQALLLHQGEQILLGRPKVVTAAYQRLSSGLIGQDWRVSMQSVQRLLEETAPNNGESIQSSFDENLLTASVISYPENNGRILGVEIIDNGNQRANTIEAGKSFTIRFEYQVDVDFENLEFGCHIANTSGLRVTGQGFPYKAHAPVTVKANSRFYIDYCFGSGLQPGIYFIGGGFWVSTDPSNYIHRVLDYQAFRITANGLRSSMGICDLTAAEPVLRLRPAEQRVQAET